MQHAQFMTGQIQAAGRRSGGNTSAHRELGASVFGVGSAAAF
jgi:hypothetical protein